jgi:signal peptidase I
MKLMLAKLFEYRKTIEHILTVLAVVCLIFSAAAMAQGKFAFFAVTRGVSMQPVFVNNDLILFAPYQASRHIRPARVGDIAVFRAPSVPPVWAHRIIEEVEPGVFLTKGDNNPHPDSFFVKEENILGIVPVLGHNTLSIPYVGWLMLRWQSSVVLRWGLLAVLLIALVAMPSENRRRLRRQVSGRAWLLQKLAIAIGCGLFFFVFTLYPFLEKSGYGVIGYQVAEGDGISYGGSASVNFGIIKEGDARKEERSVANGGLFPVVVYMDTMDDPFLEARITPSLTVLPARSAATVDFEIEAAEIGNWRQLTFTMTTVPYIMPLSWITGLSQKHPLLPNLLVSGVSSLLIAALLFMVLGRRRRRRPVPNRRYGRVMLLRGVAGGVSLGALLVFGFLLPGIIASTALSIASPAEINVTTTYPESATLAWGVYEIEIEAGKKRTVDLFWIRNDYGIDVIADAYLIRNDEGILINGPPWGIPRRVGWTIAPPLLDDDCPASGRLPWWAPKYPESWAGAELIEPGCTSVWGSTLKVDKDLPPGDYILGFYIETFTENGGLVAEWEITATVKVLPFKGASKGLVPEHVPPVTTPGS